MRRGGYSYIAVLGTSLIVTTLAVGGLSLVRLQSRTSLDSLDATKARQAAQSAVELSRVIIKDDPNWRTTFSNGHLFSSRAAGSATIAASISDPLDNQLGNNPHDPLRLSVAAAHGRATQKYQVDVAAQPIALEILSFGLHTGGSFRIRPGATLSTYGAPASTSGTLTNEGIVDADLVANSVSKQGIILGLFNGTGPIQPLPSQSLVTAYSGIGTQFTSRPNTIQNTVISPGNNSFGPTNANGVYIVRPNGNLTIRNTRIHGTLVVILSGAANKVMIDENVFFQPFRPDFPVLIVQGYLELNYRSEGEVLSEAVIKANLNPTGSPYLGVTNNTQTDNYPSEIRGLIWATQRIIWQNNGLLRGIAISEGQSGQGFDIQGNPRILYDPMLYHNPPPWITQQVDMVPDLGTWAAVVD